MIINPDTLLGDQSSPGGQNITRPTPPSDAELLRRVSVEQLILKLNDDRTREYALHILAKLRETREDLATLLWHSFGTSYIILKEILEVYPFLSTPDLTLEAAKRATNAVFLFQCIAAHPQTRKPFVSAKIPSYLYPFLFTQRKEKPYEYLRYAALGVIAALAKDVDNQDIIHFLLQSETPKYCICCMKNGNEMSKTLATMILERILSTEMGMNYCCSLVERFCAITQALSEMLDNYGYCEQTPQRPKLSKFIFKCFVRLTEAQEQYDGLRLSLPMVLMDPLFTRHITDDRNALEWLYSNVGTGSQLPTAPGGAEFQGTNQPYWEGTTSADQTPVNDTE